MRFSLYKRPLCQTLSNALDESRKTPLTSNDEFASKSGLVNVEKIIVI